MRALLRIVRRSIALKLTLTLVGFVAVSILAAGLYLNRALEAFAVESLDTRLAALAAVLDGDARSALVAGGPAAQDFVNRVARPTGSRVTLIAPDGRVVGESDRSLAELSQLENHAGRPEVRAALEGRRGRDLRRSTTVAAPLLYMAAPVRDGGRIVGVLRLALPLSAVTGSYEALHQVMLVGGALALLIALGIGVFVAGRVTHPVVEMQSIARQMSGGNFLVRAPTRSTDEIGTLGRSLNVMAGRLREKIQDLEQEQSKTTAILDAMVEGVIAVDGQEHVLLMNERARAMFGLGATRGEGKPFQEVIRNVGPPRALPGGARRPGSGAGPPRAPGDRPGHAHPGSERGPARHDRRPAGGGHGPPRRDRAAPARAGADRVRGQREPRAAHAADRDPGLSRDPPVGRARGAGERAALPRDRAAPQRAARAACSTT